MDLQHPERKMSKSVESAQGTIGLLDTDEEIRRKVRRAVTDTDGEMRYDRAAKPGHLLFWPRRAVAAPRRSPATIPAARLKNDVAAALCELLGPVRRRQAELEDDLPYVHAVLAPGGRTRCRTRMPGRGCDGAAASG